MDSNQAKFAAIIETASTLGYKYLLERIQVEIDNLLSLSDTLYKSDELLRIFAQIQALRRIYGVLQALPDYAKSTIFGTLDVDLTSAKSPEGEFYNGFFEPR